MNKDNGGSAFPNGVSYKIGEQYTPTAQDGGMTLRDYFAAAALVKTTFSLCGLSAEEQLNVAEGLYRMADAMLVARSMDKK